MSSDRGGTYRTRGSEAETKEVAIENKFDYDNFIILLNLNCFDLKSRELLSISS